MPAFANKLIAPLLLLGAIAIAYYALKPAPAAERQYSTSLPWQIEQLSDMRTRVFGLIPGYSTVRETLAQLGIDHDIAIISDKDDNSGLEIYFSHFKAGPLAGKLIVTVDANEKQLLQMRENAGHSEYMASGSRKFLLNTTDLAAAQAMRITSINFIPSAQLDAAVIDARFGTAAQRIESGAGSTHYLFPELGLDITLNDDASDSLQYVAPAEFERLSGPLQQLPDNQP